MSFPFASDPLVTRLSVAILALSLLSLANEVFAAGGGLRYKGQVLYRANKSPVAGVLVEVVEAEDDGKPTDEVLGSAHADAEGRFMVELSRGTDKPVTLAVSAVRELADSSGDRRSEGYAIKTHRTLLGFLAHPSPTKPNTILIERRRVGRGSGNSDDD